MKRTIFLFILLFCQVCLHSGCQASSTPSAQASTPESGSLPESSASPAPIPSASPSVEGNLKVDNFSFVDRASMKTDDSTVYPGSTIHARLVVSGLKQDKNGAIKASSQFQLYSPDKKLVIDQPLGPVTNQSFAPGLHPKILLFPYVAIDPGDPLGEYRIKIIVKDLLANSEVSAEKTFTAVKGRQPAEGPNLRVRDMRFALSPRGPLLVETPFPSKSRAYLLYQLEGLKTGADGNIWIQEDIKVTDPGGKVREQKNVLDHKGAPAAGGSLPVHNFVEIEPQAPAGKYTVEIDIRDKISGQSVHGTYHFETLDSQP